eukprot:TRINITY_DN4438_c0_g1_i2.p1 TRINITY_DN4438_c0_g1~~TRINITY_DN4438_c0_g1_i2.p1  ORF type:complete len:159 (-),score=36.84 TRINITY_DN4438_c0_g1_i2:187-663(-)
MSGQRNTNFNHQRRWMKMKKPFLKKHEEQRRLRFLEREIADLHEIEQFENDVREKVYTVQAPAILETSVIPQPKTEKKSAIGVKIVKRSKTDASKTDSKKESNDIHGKKVSKQDQTSTPKKIETPSPIKNQSATPKKTQPPASKPPITSLVGYGDDDE